MNGRKRKWNISTDKSLVDLGGVRIIYHYDDEHIHILIVRFIHLLRCYIFFALKSV